MHFKGSMQRAFHRRGRKKKKILQPERAENGGEDGGGDGGEGGDGGGGGSVSEMGGLVCWMLGLFILICDSAGAG